MAKFQPVPPPISVSRTHERLHHKALRCGRARRVPYTCPCRRGGHERTSPEKCDQCAQKLSGNSTAQNVLGFLSVSPLKSVSHVSMESPAVPPPSLVKYETPLSVGDDGGGAGGKVKTGSAKTVDVHLEEILNSVLPPR